MKDFKELTNGQGKFICSFESLDSFRKGAAEAEKTRVHKTGQGIMPRRKDKRREGGNRELKR